MGILALGSISQSNTFIEALKTSRGAYGNPRVWDELADQGFEIGLERVARLMREIGLCGVSSWKFRATTDSDHDHPIAENVLNRNGSFDDVKHTARTGYLLVGMPPAW